MLSNQAGCPLAVLQHWHSHTNSQYNLKVTFFKVTRVGTKGLLVNMTTCLASIAQKIELASYSSMRNKTSLQRNLSLYSARRRKKTTSCMTQETTNANRLSIQMELTLSQSVFLPVINWCKCPMWRQCDPPVDTRPSADPNYYLAVHI